MIPGVSLPGTLGSGLVKLGSLRARHWRPGLGGAVHGEVMGKGNEASAPAAALALALDDLRAKGRDAFADVADRRCVLWVQDHASIRLNGRPYRPGLPHELAGRVIHVEAKNCEDALFALEEGLRCRDLAFVVGEIAGNPRAFTFTASRRLSLAAEKHGVPLWLVRHDAVRDLSAARMRWDMRSAVSPAPLWNGQAPGIPSWRAELFRARSHTEGKWILRDDAQHLSAETGRPENPVDLVRAAGDRSLAAV